MSAQTCQCGVLEKKSECYNRMSIYQTTSAGINPVNKTIKRIVDHPLADASQTLTAADILTNMFTVSPTAPVVLSLPPPEDFVQNYLLSDMAVANAFDMVVRNMGADTATLNPPGTSTGSMVVEAGTDRRFLIRIDTIIPATYSVHDIGQTEGTPLVSTNPWISLLDSVTGGTSIQENTSVVGIAYGEDLVFGAASTNDQGISVQDNRFQLFKSGVAIGAFRGGRATGTQFNSTNSGTFSVGFGQENVVDGDYSRGGGTNSTCDGNLSWVTGNTQSCECDRSVIGGGDTNSILDPPSTTNVIFGGSDNFITKSLDTDLRARYCVLGAGDRNILEASGGTLGGGSDNSNLSTATADSFPFLGGGAGNATGSSDSSSGDLFGGSANSGVGGVLGGGTSANSRGVNSAVGGGDTNDTQSELSAVWGGTNNTIGVGLDATIACGDGATPTHANCFVFQDGTAATATLAARQVVMVGDFTVSSLDSAVSGAAATWAYVPGNAADWLTTQPTTMGEAVNRLAAAAAVVP